MSVSKLTTSAADFLPPRLSLAALRRAAETCEGCDLFRRATQTVFGKGAARVRLVLVGEQPGDQEDRTGEPFVGPAGKLLDQLVEEAEIDPQGVYVTNAVKHFKWKPQGKRRLHAKPSSREIAACRPWLDAELKVIDPDLICCLGVTASQSLLGSAFRLTQERGQIKSTAAGFRALATYHPSAVLRAPDDKRAAMRQTLLNDLRSAAAFLANQTPTNS